MAHPDPISRRLYAKAAAHAKWARTDPRAGTEAARAAFSERFLREADPDGVLSEQERFRRAHHLRRAYFIGLAAKSAAARTQGKSKEVAS